MPFKWVEPELVLTFKGVSVYKTYEHDNEAWEEPYTFTTEKDETNSTDGNQRHLFDVRELNSWKTLTSQSHGKLRKPSAETAMILKAIQNAILSGEVKAPPKPSTTTKKKKNKKAGKKK